MTPTTELGRVSEAIGSGALALAGGTDLLARPAAGPFADLRDVPELRGVDPLPDGSVRIGAMTTVAELAAGGSPAAAYPALAAAAAGLATPQIRAAATVGGNLLQRNRCGYLRNPHFDCHRSGGDGCPARAGSHPWAVVVDQGPCVAPHPSSLAVALLAHGAEAELHPGGAVPLADLYGDGADPTRDHRLADGQVLLAVRLPAPVPGERAAHLRATGHGRSEWPLVEAVARLVVTGETIESAAVAVGAVARTPLRLPAVEAALTGRPATGETAEAAAALAVEGCAPLPQTGYKLPLLRAAVQEVLDRALAAG